MSESFWKPSDEQRRTILLMEVAGLLHDLGKLSNSFIMEQSKDKPADFYYNYQLIADPLEIISSRAKDALDKICNIKKIENKIKETTGHDLVKAKVEEALAATKTSAIFNHKKDITGSLKSQYFDNWDSDFYSLAEILLGQFVSKDLKDFTGKSFEPAMLIRKLHGIAHYEKEAADRDHNKQQHMSTYAASPFGLETHIQIDSLRKDLNYALTCLPLHKISQVYAGDRHQWLEKVRECLSQGIADTCRPTNEVSLWDWGYTVATLTKAATAYIFKNGWLPDIKKLPFCTLRINLDILDRYTHSDKISDLLGVQKVLNDAFQEVQIRLEEKYALGNQFYRDETGAYYLLPDIFDNTEQTALREEIQALFPPDLRPQVHFSNPITAGDLDVDKSRSRELVAEPRKQALNQEPIKADNNLYLFETEWKEGRPKNAEICTVCGVRPIGYPRQDSQHEVEKDLSWATQQKSEQRKICRICLKRRGRRAEEWVRGNTIWTDEVADDNGRSALFIGKLGLEGWLDGKLLSTIQVTSNTAKNPSPARLYRIAETARAFWEKVADKLMPNLLGQCPFRLELRPQESNLEDLQKELDGYHAYDLDVDGVVLSVVWDKENKRFLTTDNLNYFANQLGLNTPEKLVGKLKDKTLEILEPSVFLKSSQPVSSKSSQRLLKVSIEEVKWTNDGYQPAISLLTEPSLCLMLIPANKALELARQVKAEYEQQMGRVRDRLPLNIGLVFCNRRTPIRAVLEAGRAILNLSEPFDMESGKGWEGWKLVKKEASGSSCKLEFNNGITWHIPVVAGDSNKKDEWYPRMYQGDRWDKRHPKHANDLAVRNDRMPKDKGAKLWIRPSHFDFEFLDTSARRFEIYYDKNGRRRPCHTRPFYLEDLDRFDTLWKILKTLETSQRHQVIYTIEATREMWYGQDEENQSVDDAVFQQFVEHTLTNATWRKDKKWWSMSETERQQLIQAGIRGELADLAELHMEILKER